MVSMRNIIKLTIVIPLFLLLQITILNAEELLIKGDAKYLGWRTGLDQFTTCYKNVIPIGNGYIKTTDSKCQYQSGISPIAKEYINGKVINIYDYDKRFTIKDDKSGKLYTLYSPHLHKNLKIGENISVIVPIEGRAELIKSHNKAFENAFDVGALLMASFELMNAGKFDKAQKLLDKILEKDPGNPLALNNLAAIMVKQDKFDKADAYLNQALPRAKDYMVQVNRVCQVRGICVAFQPASGGTGNQGLEALIKLNLDMLKQYMAAKPLSGRGPR